MTSSRRQTEIRLPQLMLVAVVMLVMAYFVFPLFNSQGRNLEAVRGHIESIDRDWTAFTVENPQYHELELFGYTGGDGMLGVVGMVESEEDKIRIVAFLEGTKPPRPVHSNAIRVMPGINDLPKKEEPEQDVGLDAE